MKTLNIAILPNNNPAIVSIDTENNNQGYFARFVKLIQVENGMIAIIEDEAGDIFHVDERVLDCAYEVATKECTPMDEEKMSIKGHSVEVEVLNK